MAGTSTWLTWALDGSDDGRAVLFLGGAAGGRAGLYALVDGAPTPIVESDGAFDGRPLTGVGSGSARSQSSSFVTLGFADGGSGLFRWTSDGPTLVTTAPGARVVEIDADRALVLRTAPDGGREWSTWSPREGLVRRAGTGDPVRGSARPIGPVPPFPVDHLVGDRIYVADDSRDGWRLLEVAADGVRIVADRRSLPRGSQLLGVVAGGPSGVAFDVQGEVKGLWVARECRVESVGGQDAGHPIPDAVSASWSDGALVLLGADGIRYVARPRS